MPVIENLKNFIKERHHNHHHHQQQQPAQQQQQPQQQQQQPQSNHYQQQSKPEQVLPASNDQDRTQISKGQHMNEPKPQPVVVSATIDQKPNNNDLNPPSDQTGSHHTTATSPLRSPNAAAIGGTALASHGEQAEAIIEKARLEKSKLPVYEGLPEHFVLIEKMGDGAFSNVYKALDKRTSTKVAIKCVRKFELNRNQEGKHLNAELKKKPRAIERANILKEVSIMRTLNHPSIIKLISFTESQEHYFLILELMEGGELFHQIVKLTYFSEELARHVILQVARGIRYLHEEKGVVHRDIKPENLLFEAIPIVRSKTVKQRPYDEEKEDEGEFLPNVGGGGIGQVKIADFGLSKIVWQDQTATPCGTVGYTAPEIVKDERYSKSVDMWAMGCVLYTLLCGFPPFFDESIQVLTEKVARGYYTFLSPWWDDISDSSKDLISHLLCVDPEKRYTIDEFLAHPWCKEKAPLPEMNTQEVATMAPHIMRAKQMNYAPIDSPLLHATGGGMRTPGVAQLREAFDVTYAVHRMEEEGARRVRYGGAGNAGVLHGLNEEEEEEESGGGGDNKNAGSSKANNQKYQAWGGAGGADRHLAEKALYSGQAGTRDRGSSNTNRSSTAQAKSKLGQKSNAPPRHTGFELNIDQATLLGRRNKLPTPIE
ncbi:hypothetical protein Pst134EA_029489 [Puccinia striiformis f. sp. tritici]|uniref:CAMK/CAMK1/CAMK1-RCK protein kinase n=1 Tax=Puccinia striiformis f. sp. tritici PST-78 TaxID=1165861 RepID=A0A0L0V6D6_9BASI|nr:hypothetical protein Pst134EA_029489 [Puccinia striiformis f. sp. tritici]KAH9447453.1 hypothetical protein Pst134EA_029489 [Puccinia striiformis f. sp. tritici]KNE94833.1 CAMK/CAMK1/CAMK1-RCK protein kinase [Puccinia striiformis f. sp. tritici PST-78]